MIRKGEKIYSGKKLAGFCMKTALLWEAGELLSEGFQILAEDVVPQKEKEMLRKISLDLETGEPFYAVLEKMQIFPAYVIQMAKLGQRTGNLGEIMKALAVYYEKEDRIGKNIRSAVIYFMIMSAMFFGVLFVLFMRVMPMFERACVSLGVGISPVYTEIFRFGGIFSGGILILLFAAALFAAVKAGLRMEGVCIRTDRLKEIVKNHSRIFLAVAKQRFTSVMAITLRCGIDLDKGMELAEELVDHRKVALKIRKCTVMLQEGADYADAVKETGLFDSIHIQMIKVGRKSGRLAEVMCELSKDYERQAEDAVINLIIYLEPVMEVVLAFSAGVILLSLMFPLAGVLAEFG